MSRKDLYIIGAIVAAVWLAIWYFNNAPDPYVDQKIEIEKAIERAEVAEKEAEELRAEADRLRNEVDTLQRTVDKNGKELRDHRTRFVPRDSSVDLCADFVASGYGSRCAVR